MKNNATKKILIINPEGSYLTNPTLSAFGRSLVARGYSVKIFAPKNHLYKDDKRFISYGVLARKIKTLLIERLFFFNLDWIAAIINLIMLREAFDLVIGVDRQGIVEAAPLCRLFGARKGFFSFEIMFEDETSKLYKKREVTACEKISFWVVQDEVRARLISGENKLDCSSKIVVPVASAKNSQTANSSVRNYLGISRSSKVAALIGSLSELTLFEEVLDSVGAWPNNWVLLVHDKDGTTRSKIEKYFAKTQCSYTHRIFVSDKTIGDIDGLGELLNGVDAGIAFYSATYKSKYLGKNVEFIGASSGKISTYAMYGIPVITNLSDWHSDMLAKYNYGVRIDSPSYINGALDYIEKNGEWLKSNTIKFYEQQLDYRLFEKSLMDAVEKCFE